jgi:hypothetical protein
MLRHRFFTIQKAALIKNFYWLKHDVINIYDCKYKTTQKAEDDSRGLMLHTEWKGLSSSLTAISAICGQYLAVRDSDFAHYLQSLPSMAHTLPSDIAILHHSGPSLVMSGKGLSGSKSVTQLALRLRSVAWTMLGVYANTERLSL